ncbi:MAG: hypothetical protein K8F54_04535 [Altibacter sp.]|uniref:hypothetical protein n=1 Tax=Altibacter sp. TaxID=2024823 RepID=UPI001D75EBAC|nr:hypothetical protein [Altibacter sp.]MBZ0326847.1 hypothetical protein [Altibacter sp.]
MKKLISTLVLGLLLTSCGAKKSPVILSSSTNATETSDHYEPFFDVTEYAENEAYGLSGEYPVMVGGRSAENQRRYLSSLAGPRGEVVTFHRRGSCCEYDSENGFDGVALVDVYEVVYGNLKQPILVYISFYDSEKLFIPKGFTKRNL